MRFLRSNTAVIITVGPFYDKTDGVTIKTALTITNEKITLTADTDNGSAPTNILDNVTGATSGTANDLNYITGNDAGMMQMELAAADTNRLGRMFLSITDAANHVPVFHEFMVVNTALYDAFFASSGGAIPNIAVGAGTAGALPVIGTGTNTFKSDASANVTFANTSIATVTTVTNPTGVWQDATAGDFTATNSIGKSVMNGVALGTGLTINDLTTKTGYSLVATTGLGNQTANISGNLSGSVGSVTAGVTVTTNNDKTGYGLSAAAVQAIWDALTSALTTVGSIGKKLADWTIGTAQTGDSFARLGAPVGASVSADIAGIPAAVLATAVDGSVTVAQSIRLQNSAMGGKASGLATTAVAYRDLADSKDRIAATVDASGNRSAVTLDLT
jgi:hypothetical protein